MSDTFRAREPAEGKDTLRKSALHNYGLYILSFAAGDPDCFLRYDAAQKAAFHLGLLAQEEEQSPFSKLIELDEFYQLGKISAFNYTLPTTQNASKATFKEHQ